MILKTNKQSCVLDSFSHASGVPTERLIRCIGHDGAEVGHNTQELIDAMLMFGFATIEIQRFPCSVHPYTGALTPINEEKADERFADYLVGSTGVLLGTSFLKPHAVSWKHNQIHDPATGKSSTLLLEDYQKSSESIDSRQGFVPIKFLMLRRIT